MNEYLKAFQSVNQSADQLIQGMYSAVDSPEIKQSASDLQQSIQPCIQELRLSAIRLKGLLQNCFTDLDCAEDVWSSKQRIVEASQVEIWQEIGVASGCISKIKRLRQQDLQTNINENVNLWTSGFNDLIDNHFMSPNNQIKEGLGWSDKENFIKALSIKIDSHNQKIEDAIEKAFDLILQGFDTLNMETLKSYINLLELRQQIEIKTKIEAIKQEIYEKFNDLTGNLSNVYLLKFTDTCKSRLDNWQKRWGDLLRSEALEFQTEMAAKIEQRMSLLIDDRIALVIKALEEAIAFYNDFLELQTRYRQETPEQRMAEKAWIDQQHQALEQVQKGIEAILE